MPHSLSDIPRNPDSSPTNPDTAIYYSRLRGTTPDYPKTAKMEKAGLLSRSRQYVHPAVSSASLPDIGFVLSPKPPPYIMDSSNGGNNQKPIPVAHNVPRESPPSDMCSIESPRIHSSSSYYHPGFYRRMVVTPSRDVTVERSAVQSYPSDKVRASKSSKKKKKKHRDKTGLKKKTSKGGSRGSFATPDCANPSQGLISHSRAGSSLSVQQHIQHKASTQVQQQHRQQYSSQQQQQQYRQQHTPQQQTQQQQYRQQHTPQQPRQQYSPQQQMQQQQHTPQQQQRQQHTPQQQQQRQQHTPQQQTQQQQQQTQQAQQQQTQQQQQPKKPKRIALLAAIRPENPEEEKEKFMKSKGLYNPQFVYKYPICPVAMKRFAHPSDKLIPLAESVMKNVLKRHGTFESFLAKSGGRLLNKEEILEACRKFLEQEGLVSEVCVRISEDILARAFMTRCRGQPTLQVRNNSIREKYVDGLLRHEVGTHFLRSFNNRLQPWWRSKKRREMGLLPLNPSEEGLAALHSVIFRPEPSLFRSALLYYTAYMASKLSFSQLFQDLGRFVQDPLERWDYCMRAKRGQEDTSLPGTFCKDQVYLQGSLEILRHRQTIDFHCLVKCGKVAYQDVEKLKELADLEHSRIPGFMLNLDLYREKLAEILHWNGLSDEDLRSVL